MDCVVLTEEELEANAMESEESTLTRSQWLHEFVHFMFAAYDRLWRLI